VGRWDAVGAMGGRRVMGGGSGGATVGTMAGVAWRLPQAVGSDSMGSNWIKPRYEQWWTT
jgi:hypothetical protein